MSWDADLYTKDSDGNEIQVGEWNYTHNLNPAINEALGNPDIPTYWAAQFGGQWWKLIEGKTAKETAPLFESIIAEFERQPDKYKAMEPDNGWGHIDTLIPVLREMANAGQTYPSAIWKCWG